MQARLFVRLSRKLENNSMIAIFSAVEDAED